MAISLTQLYTPASADEIRDDFLTDVRLEARKHADTDEVDRITRPGTDWYILATAMGNLGLLQYSNIAKSATNANVLTATGQSLDNFREALGLPIISASPATGRIVVTVVTNPANFNNHEFVLPNGKRGRVDGVHSVNNGGEVPVITIDAGSDCNFPPNTVVRFVSPPPNVLIEAKVSVNSPLIGGTDDETDERKRDRILNRLRFVPAGGNWGYCIEQAMNALASVQMAFVYPALGGPASTKVVIVRDIDPDNYYFARTFDTAAVELVRDALHSVMPDEMEVVVSSATSEYTDVALTVKLPSATASGGNGLGWLDATPWPNLAGGQTRVRISAVSADGKTITVDATTAVSPIAGQTHISWWSRVDQKFVTRLVVVVGGGGGAWVLTLDQPLVDHNNAVANVNEFISPAAVNIVEYGNTWRNSLRRLGPGENTSDVNRLPRSLRRPFVEQEWDSSLTVQQLIEMVAAHPEIQDAAWSYRSVTTPTVPASVATDPNILVPQQFGIYPQ